MVGVVRLRVLQRPPHICVPAVVSTPGPLLHRQRHRVAAGVAVFVRHGERDEVFAGRQRRRKGQARTDGLRDLVARPDQSCARERAVLRIIPRSGKGVEILGVISLFGYLNRWNDSMGTEMENGAIESGTKLLKQRGWTTGKHAYK